MTDNIETRISLELSEEEALVLFEHLFIFESKLDHVERMFTAEEIVFFRIQAQLENRLVAPIQHTYREQLKAARERIIASAYAPDPEPST